MRLPSTESRISSQAGFTLIELVVVIIVIGILAGIGVVRYADLNTTSSETQNDANARSIKSAIMIYYADRHIADPSYTMADAVADYNANPATFFNNGTIPTKADGSAFNVSINSGIISVN